MGKSRKEFLAYKKERSKNLDNVLSSHLLNMINKLDKNNVLDSKHVNVCFSSEEYLDLINNFDKNKDGLIVFYDKSKMNVSNYLCNRLFVLDYVAKKIKFLLDMYKLSYNEVSGLFEDIKTDYFLDNLNNALKSKGEK